MTATTVQSEVGTVPSEHEQRLLDRIQKHSAVIGVVGLGYVGLPLAVEFARAGFRVIGYDISRRVVMPSMPAGRTSRTFRRPMSKRWYGREPLRPRATPGGSPRWTPSRSPCRRRS